jgi:hypothetical protein
MGFGGSSAALALAARAAPAARTARVARVRVDEVNVQPLAHDRHVGLVPELERGTRDERPAGWSE